MVSCTSPFCTSTIPLHNNAIKSLLLGCGAVFAGFMVRSLFSLAAARANRFGAHLMFEQSLKQRALYVFSRGFFTLARFLVLAFSTFEIMAGLYGTMLWALDNPGFVLAEFDRTLADFTNPLAAQRDYIVQVAARPTTDLAALERDLARRFSANLFDPGLNITLAGMSGYGQARVVSPTQNNTAPRIWVDRDGLSVSPDSYFMLMTKATENGTLVGLDTCFQLPLGDTAAWYWNCTFDNTFAQQQLLTLAGRPEVHWDDVSDLATDSRYIRPSRYDNIWASYGQGAGTAVMKQVFTVTKSNRRYTFLQTVLRATMVRPPASPFPASEIDDLLQRSWSTNTTEQATSPLLPLLTRAILRAQSLNQSYTFGLTEATPNGTTVSQLAWEFLTAQSNHLPIYSILRYSTTTITLLRAETLPHAITPNTTTGTAPRCAANYMTLAYGGGQPTATDCLISESGPLPAAPRFFGQVDTAAVFILTGLGDGTAATGAAALDQTVLEWIVRREGTVDELLAARAFAVGVASAAGLVKVKLVELVAAASWLQMMLVFVVAVGAVVGEVMLARLAAEPWGHSLLWNLVGSLRGMERQSGKGWWGWVWTTLVLGGDLRRMPEMELRVGPGEDVGVLEMDGKEVGWAEEQMPLVANQV